MHTANTMNVLIIDDEAVICLFLQNMLENMHIASEYANSIEEGLKKADSMKPDIIFLDINLPDGNGIKAISNLKTRLNGFRNSAIVMISAYDTPADRQMALAEGAAYFLSKPFTRSQVLTVLETINNNGKLQT